MNDYLECIATVLKENGINYAFSRWNGDSVPLYFIGEYNEPEPTEEDQYSEISFKLTGFTRESRANLEAAKNKIKQIFDRYTATMDDGSLVVIWYAGSLPIPIDEGELKRIEITLKIQEWKVK